MEHPPHVVHRPREVHEHDVHRVDEQQPGQPGLPVALPVVGVKVVSRPDDLIAEGAGQPDLQHENRQPRKGDRAVRLFVEPADPMEMQEIDFPALLPQPLLPEVTGADVAHPRRLQVGVQQAQVGVAIERVREGADAERSRLIVIHAGRASRKSGRPSLARSVAASVVMTPAERSRPSPRARGALRRRTIARPSGKRQPTSPSRGDGDRASRGRSNSGRSAP